MIQRAPSPQRHVAHEGVDIVPRSSHHGGAGGRRIRTRRVKYTPTVMVSVVVSLNAAAAGQGITARTSGIFHGPSGTMSCSRLASQLSAHGKRVV
jgi:hypothetical protein